MQVEKIDRELFIDILNPDSSTAESVRQGRSYTWEVEQLARHRHKARTEVVGEIVAWLEEMYENCESIDGMLTRMDSKDELANMMQAKFGKTNAPD